MSVKAGLLLIKTLVEPGTHGAGITGIHGAGVGVPIAAAVAAATVGFDGVVHIPKGGMFFIGMLSMIVAAGVITSVLFSGVTISALGASPKLHFIMAPAVTSFGMDSVGAFGFRDETRTPLEVRADFSLRVNFKPGLRLSHFGQAEKKRLAPACCGVRFRLMNRSRTYSP